MTETLERAALGLRITPSAGASMWRLVQRNYLSYRSYWWVFLSGMFEPVLYLLSIGIGVGGLVGDFTLADGSTVGYVEFVAPAMLATSAMNGAIMDATYSVFFKLRYDKLYEGILATPVRPVDIARGEITWSLLRGAIYSGVFILVMLAMGLVQSWWMVLGLPAAMLIAFAFAGAGMALTTWMKSWQDFEYIQLGIVPMFLFSATFFPLSTYPDAVEVVVQCTPLYQGVVLTRDMALGSMGWDSVVAATYLAVMGSIGLAVASRRVGTLLLK
jgi:lipooligosaccharide transport system permease protein